MEETLCGQKRFMSEMFLYRERFVMKFSGGNVLLRKILVGKRFIRDVIEKKEEGKYEKGMRKRRRKKMKMRYKDMYCRRKL